MESVIFWILLNQKNPESYWINGVGGIIGGVIFVTAKAFL